MVLRLLATIALAALPIHANGPVLRDGTGKVAAIDGPAILLFWAEWCAPCRGEVARLPELQREAGPVPILIAPIDDSARARRLLANLDPARLRYAGNNGWRWMQTLSGGSSGLPVGIAIDRTGKVCGVVRKGVDAAQIANWRASCDWQPAR